MTCSTRLFGALCVLSLSALAFGQSGLPQYYMAPQVATYPTAVAPTQNQVTPQKAVLGKILFWEEQLSHDDTMACGTCHNPQAGGIDSRVVTAAAKHPGPDGLFNTADDRTGSPGVVSSLVGGAHTSDGVFYPRKQVTGRRAPTFLDRGFEDMLFWDGRAGNSYVGANGVTLISSGAALESLALQPLLNSAEMGCQQRTAAHVVAKLQTVQPLALAVNVTADIQAALAANPTYPQLFTAAFGLPYIDADRIAFALATYMRTLRADQTPFDLFVAANGGSINGVGGPSSALSSQQLAGLQAFVARCSSCHAMPMFGSQSFQSGAATFTSQFAVAGLNNPLVDPGRSLITGNPAHLGQVKIPTLRNVGLREPFGLTRTGIYDTLESIVESYAAGGTHALNIASTVANRGNPFSLLPPFTTAEKANIVAFLRNALTDPRVAQGLPPFDKPTLRSELPNAPTRFGDANTGTGGENPVVVATQPPALGTWQYTVGVGNALGGVIAVLALNTVPSPPGTVINGVPVNISLVPTPITATVSTSGQGAGDGVASLTFPLPAQPSLQGFNLYGQWFIADPMAPLGIAASEGFQMTLF